MNIYSSITELAGHTPLVKLTNYSKKYELCATLVAKLECYNPAGSVKDRVAREMILSAEAEGRLVPGGTIIEPTSGNTGIGLAAIAVARGYRAIIVMPDSMSMERRKLMTAYGAQLVLTPGAEGVRGAIVKAEELQKQIPNSIIAGQFDNPANPLAHIKTTGPEIWQDTDGGVDIFVAGVGTGGTVSGTGRYLKSQRHNIKVVAAEPQSSPFLTKGVAGTHKIQGIGAGFLPRTMDVSVCDDIVTVSDESAYAAARELAVSDGILVGISSGAALYAARLEAQKPENEGKLIVVLLPDSGDRYLSTDLF